ncbi:MAG: hypothetical protein KDN05_01800, partial [Verrucomicrobiae bacterium]|nr:hypothetical protein [Verrucomicrobiae bacterium]
LDTRCDIHSLGAVLFEMLTGEAPVRSDRIRDLDMDEIRKILREEEPRIPSSVLASLRGEELAAVAMARGCDGQKLILRIRGDLDWIVAMAMDRERERRYESAHGLALDVRRHLSCEAVNAGPPDRFYRLAKLVRRNKVPFLSGAVALVALVAGFGTSTVLFLREKQAKNEQERLRAGAEMARNAEQELRRRAEFRERISHAAVLVSHGDLEGADHLLKSVPFGEVPLSLEASEAYLRVGEWHVLAERWKEASDCFANLAVVLPSIDPTDSFDISVVVIRAAALLCHTGDRERYDIIRRQAIDRFADTSSPVVAEQVFKASLILPPDADTLARLKPLAAFLEKCINEGHPEIAGNDFRTSWCCFAMALMRYREGNLDIASAWAERALPIAGGHVPRETMLRCLRAMIARGKGDVPTANVLLNEAFLPIDAYLSKPIELGDAMASWSDWLIARNFYREARPSSAR